MPFWHGEEATKYLKAFIGEEHYAYDDRNIWGALWETYNDCQFVEDEGEFESFVFRVPPLLSLLAERLGVGL